MYVLIFCVCEEGGFFSRSKFLWDYSESDNQVLSSLVQFNGPTHTNSGSEPHQSITPMKHQIYVLSLGKAIKIIDKECFGHAS